MKLVISMRICILLWSRPVWGAWIEINLYLAGGVLTGGRAPYGARGLKCKLLLKPSALLAVAPRMGRVD